MEVMRKFTIELKPDGTMKWVEVCDEPDVEYRAYKNIFLLCKKLGKFLVTSQREGARMTVFQDITKYLLYFDDTNKNEHILELAEILANSNNFCPNRSGSCIKFSDCKACWIDYLESERKRNI